MENPEKEEDPRRCTAVAPQRQDSESSSVFNYFSDLEPLDSVGSWFQAGHPGPEREALMVGDVNSLWGSTWTEQAMEEHPSGLQSVVQRFIDSSPDAYQDWHQIRSFNSQEARPHHHAPCQQLYFDAVMPCHSSPPRSHDYCAGHNHAGYSSGVPPPSLLNQGHPLLSNGGPQESSSCQQISDASKMPLQYPSDQEQFIQKPEDSKSSLLNLGHPLLSNGGPQESSSWQQISGQYSDASKMPLQYASDREQLIQMPEDLKSNPANLGHPLLSNGGLQESSSWQQIGDASKMPLQYPGGQKQLIQMPKDSKSSLPNLGHALLSNGGLRESSSWQQISDESKMPLQQQSDQEQLIQMPEDLESSFVFCNPNLEVSNLVGDGQHGDGATTTLKNWSNGNASKSQDPDGVVEPNSVTPKRGRRKAANATESGSSLRCKCRRSRCLKLYCECFAAGFYCIESCACKDCYNSLNFEDLVLETRRQIESRAPLAFGPKVVQHASNSPTDKAEGGGSEATPSSVRHKRGCNCKKSQCLKKYCECYQAKAGCSHECNCEDCCNPFSLKSAEQRIKRRDTSPNGKLDSMQDMPNSTGTGTGGQSALPQEGTVNTITNTPSSSPLACSNYPNTRGCSSSAQAKRCQGTMPLHLPGSPVKIPPSDRTKASHDLVGVSPTHDMAKGVSISKMDSSSLPKPANAGSPNQRQVSTPQFQSPGRSPSISPSSRRARKPDLQTRPPPDGKTEGSSSEA